MTKFISSIVLPLLVGLAQINGVLAQAPMVPSAPLVAGVNLTAFSPRAASKLAIAAAIPANGVGWAPPTTKSNNTLHSRAVGTTLFPNEYPYSATGKVWLSLYNPGLNQYVVYKEVSASLIAQNVIIISSRFLIWDSRPWGLVYAPSYRDGASPFGTTFATACQGYPPGANPVSGHDYTVCRLNDASMGTRTGWLGYMWEPTPIKYQGRFVTTVGWPQQPAVFHGQVEAWKPSFILEGFSVEGDGVRLIQSPFNPVDGWEGGPLYVNLQPGSAGDPRVIAVLSGTQGDGKTVFSGGQAMVGLADWARTNWPA